MKTALKFILPAFLIALLTSCEDVVQVKLDEGSKLYVIDAFVDNLRAKQTIRVTTNDSYFSNRVAPPVPNASVILKDLTENKQYVFTYQGDGNYVYDVVANNDTLAKLNHQYELNVTLDGNLYTALGTQKRTAKIDSVGREYFNGDNGFGPPSDPYYLCTLFAKDKVDANTDYYRIKTYRNDTLFSGSGDINVCIDGTGGAVTNAELDSTYFTAPATFLGFKQYLKGNTCKVEVHSISKETYFFFVQAQAQINNGGLFATTPENVKTNISTPKGATKAVGWFNMASVATASTVIPQ